MRDLAIKFFSEQSQDARTVENERGLQLELGLMFRSRGFDVRFEVSCAVPSHARQTKRQKRNIDLLVTDGTIHLVIELKVPLSGRVPETMYDFFADVAFVEAVVGSGMADEGLCILLTSDQHFWSDYKWINAQVNTLQNRETDGIYGPLRVQGCPLQGEYEKPTGERNTTVFVSQEYYLSWSNLGNRHLLSDTGKFVVVEVENDVSNI